jgi:hypothetical protein
MVDGQERAKSSLPAGAWVVPAIVVLGDLGYWAWLGQSPASLDKLGPVLIFMFLVVPGSVLFLAAYAATMTRLRDSPRQRGTLLLVALSTLVGLTACALAFGLLAGALLLEAKLRAK